MFVDPPGDKIGIGPLPTDKGVWADHVKAMELLDDAGIPRQESFLPLHDTGKQFATAADIPTGPPPEPETRDRTLPERIRQLTEMLRQEKRYHSYQKKAHKAAKHELRAIRAHCIDVMGVSRLDLDDPTFLNYVLAACKPPKVLRILWRRLARLVIQEDADE